MDLKLYEQITSEEALEIMAKQGWVFDINERQYSIQDREFKVKGKYVVDALMGMSLNEFLVKEWFVKKPFDVRAEMLARPNEWVGAYKSDAGTWYKVGFDYPGMSAVEVLLPNNDARPHYSENKVFVASEKWINKCIPIEDVPTEELT